MTLNSYLLDRYGYNEPIYSADIRFEDYSRPWVFKELKKLVDNGYIKRFDTGIYYFPKKMPWGESMLNPRKVIEQRFLSNGNDIYGYIAGISLLNQAGLSTQVPNLIELVTNNESTRVRNVMIGSQCVRARRSRTPVTKDNVKILQFLDLMNSIKPAEIDETERLMLSKYVEASKVTRTLVAKYAVFFPAKATKNMLESGVIYEIA